MTLGSAFHVVTFSLFRVHIHIHDSHQIPSVTGTGQLQVQWEDVPPTVGNSPAQGTLWNPIHNNVVNYGAVYPELASLSNDVRICTINLPINLHVTHQDFASPHTDPNVGPAHQQGIPENMQIVFLVSANLFSLHMSLIESITTGESRRWLFWPCPQGCCTRPHPSRLFWFIYSPRRRCWPASGRESPQTREPLHPPSGFTG